MISCRISFTFGENNRPARLFKVVYMRSTKLLLLNLSLVSVFLLVAYYYWFPAIWHCQTVRFGPFTSHSGGLYISDEATASQRDSLLHSIARSRQRIRAFWGRQVGDSSIIFCHDKSTYSKFALMDEGAGCSLGTPTGSWIVLNPDGLNVDVISHEMCHDELFTRLGWFKTKNSVPQWFDEGLALMVDYRFTNPDTTRRHHDYLDEWMMMTHHGSDGMELTDIRTVKGFFGGDRHYVNKAYLTSGLEVSRWLSVVGTSGLHDLLRAVRQGESFDTAYQRLEKANRQLTDAPRLLGSGN